MASTPFVADHDHIFLGEGHDRNARKTWFVIALCTVVMIVELVGGLRYGSLALIADGMHMSTHAAAMLIAALAYRYARMHARDSRFSFGTGKMGDLAGFSSAIILAMIALLIGYEAISRLIEPVRIDFNQAIAIAFLGLFVNVVSAWLLSGEAHTHGHSHEPGHAEHGHEDETHFIETPVGPLQIAIHEDGVPPRFRLQWLSAGSISSGLACSDITLTTVRTDGESKTFRFRDAGGYFESTDNIPEPHTFEARLDLRVGGTPFVKSVFYTEPENHGHSTGAHGSHHRDHNMRAAFVHVAADAAVSVLAILGLSAGKFYGLNFMDPVMGIVGALVIANWSVGLIRDTGAILLDMNPDAALSREITALVKAQGDSISDLHLWRLGPGHLGAIVAIQSRTRDRDASHYRRLLSRFRDISHLTLEVRIPSDH